MSDAQTPAPRGSILSEIDLPLFASMSLHTVLVYVAVVLARVTASYAMLDLGLSFFWVGVISSAYALIPIFIAVPLGRLNDRGYDSLTIRAGSVGLTLAALIFWLVTPGPLSLFIATAILGVGQITCMGGHQMVCLRAGKTTRGRDAVFGYQMVAIASGLGFGPLLVAWIAGDALRPPISLLFGMLVIVTLLTLASSFLVTSGPTRDRKTDAAAPVDFKPWERHTAPRALPKGCWQGVLRCRTASISPSSALAKSARFSPAIFWRAAMCASPPMT